MPRWILWTRFGTVLAINVCTQSLTPRYPAVARDLRVDAGAFGAILGGAFLMALLLQLPLGVAGDRFGRRPFLAAWAVVMTAAQVLRWRAGSAGEFAVAQGLAGVGMACVVVANFPSVADAYTAGRPQAIGLTNLAINLV